MELARSGVFELRPLKLPLGRTKAGPSLRCREKPEEPRTRQRNTTLPVPSSPSFQFPVPILQFPVPRQRLLVPSSQRPVSSSQFSHPLQNAGSGGIQASILDTIDKNQGLKKVHTGWPAATAADPGKNNLGVQLWSTRGCRPLTRARRRPAGDPN